MELRQARRQRRREKPASILNNELIVDDLAAFLEGRDDGAVLDLGAGRKPYAHLYEPHFKRSFAVDIGARTEGIDLIEDASQLPFPDETFGCVICTEVLEHLPNPLEVLQEIRRVLKPSGALFLTTPLMYGLHEAPHDYYRYTPWALEDLGSRAGLEVSVSYRGDWLGTVLALLLWPVSKVLGRNNPLRWPLLVAPQLMYLAYWRSGRRVKRFENTPLGFTTIMVR